MAGRLSFFGATGNNRGMKLLSGVALVLASLAIAACGGSSDDSDTTTPSSGDTGTTVQQEQNATGGEGAAEGGGAEAGKSVFAANCASCHTLAAADATGSVGPDLDQVKPSLDKIKQMVEEGGGAMPAFAGQLSDDEITDVSEFVADNAGK